MTWALFFRSGTNTETNQGGALLDRLFAFVNLPYFKTRHHSPLTIRPRHSETFCSVIT